MKVAHICPETGEHYIVSARWNGNEYEPCCGHCDDREVPGVSVGGVGW